LRPLPVRRYEYAERKTAKVNLDYHIEYEKHLYSVPYALIHQKVDIRASERMIEVFHHGKSVAVHPRSFQQGRYSTRPEHLPPNHRFMNELNAESFIQWATSIGPQTKQLITATLKSRTYPEQAYRTCLGILELSNKYPFPLMEQACQSALEARFFSYKVIKEELTLIQQQDPQPILETLPGHKYIRGADYYKEKTLS
jgi:transposase